MNAISIIKLAKENRDCQLNIETFDDHSIFTWDHGKFTMTFEYGSSSLPVVNVHNEAVTPECNTFQKFSHSAIHSKSDTVRVPLPKAATLFSRVSSKDLGQILNPQPLSDLEKECSSCHHCLKCIPKQHVDRLMQLWVLPYRLGLVTPPPCLGRILNKAKWCSWRSKSEPPTIRHKKDALSGTSVSLDYLMSSAKGIKLQLFRKLTSAPISGVCIFSGHFCKPPFVQAELLSNFALDSSISVKV